jgi:hypothetical protein
MALTPEDIKQVNEQFEKLVSQLDAIDQRSLRETKQSLAEGRITLEQWNREVKRFNKQLLDAYSTLDFVAKSFKDSVNELSTQNTYLTNTKNILRDVSKNAQKAASIRSGESSMDEKALRRAKENLALQKDALRTNIKSGQLTAEERAEAISSFRQLDKYGKALDDVLGTHEQINKELGFGPQLIGGIDKQLQKLGFPSLGVADALSETQKLGQQAASTGDKFSAVGTFTKELGKNISDATSTSNLIQLAFVAIGKKIVEINKLQTDFRRLTGESATNINVLNDSLITTSDQLKTMVGLTEQFGFNANVAFDAINIQEATELSELMGLSAEEAGNLAYLAQASGKNLKVAAANLYSGVDGAFSQKKLLQDIGKVSSSIAMTFGGNLELMGKTANEAKRLGLNLQQVDKIAEGLLDIENSIRAEFEAEVVSGKQLNLERARFFALTNDLNGLTKEIASNQEIINSFAKGDRIEQQAIAEALGLSRDEVSKMIFDQAILNELSTEEAARRAGMSIEDAKRLTIQQSITKSIGKMTEALAAPLELLAAMVSNSFILYTTLGSIATLYGTRLVGSIGKSLAALKMFNIEEAKGLALAIGKAAAWAAANPLKAFLGIAAAGAAAAALYRYSKPQKTEDGIAPASKGPFTITDSYGGTAITAKGDSLAVSPNITREGRNTPSSMQLDYDRLADAIAKGAETGTSRARLTARVDNRQFAANQQTSQVIEQYRFSS